MNTVNKLLDTYREKCSLRSDMALAAALGIKRQSVHAWRHGAAWPSDEHIATMAAALGQETMAWLIPIHAERASGPVKKDWLLLAKTLGYATASITLAVGLAVYTPNSEAYGLLNNNGTGYTLCVHIWGAQDGSVLGKTAAQGTSAGISLIRHWQLARRHVTLRTKHGAPDQ